MENMSDDDRRGCLVQLEQQVQAALDEIMKRDRELMQQKEGLAEAQRKERVLEARVIDLVEEREVLRKQQDRVQEENQRLQGFLLDGMSADDLNKLIHNLTDAAKRVKMSVQMRKFSATSPGSNLDSNKHSSVQG